ncbi:MAG: SMI1/KNR4 family protein [Isosphaeraceae bacterium]|nr:SMI1/KNR4 family protein [Isosphaeraceae bacterium]
MKRPPHSQPTSRLADAVGRWCDLRGVRDSERPDLARLEVDFAPRADPLRPPASIASIERWEERHGFRLPEGLRDWLSISDGFQLDGPVIHPLAAIGPMVPFARMPDLVVQPESWFELGNPNVETVCFDLAYRMPGGDCPLFTSGDDLTGSRPRIIAAGFDPWFLGLLAAGGREYWFDPGAPTLGDPWEEHRRRVPTPVLDDRLLVHAPTVERLLRDNDDERAIAQRLGLSRLEVELITRFLQHHQPSS